ncbi:MAG: hypothetical protein KO464_02240 [Candidatus Methanofastidiosum sp.]|nr:hypothetical protein [Methanofastidiosum sp.]
MQTGNLVPEMSTFALVIGGLIVVSIFLAYVVWWLRFSRRSVFYNLRLLDSLMTIRHQRIIQRFNGGPEYTVMTVTLDNLIVLIYKLLGAYKGPEVGKYRVKAMLTTEILDHYNATKAAMELYDLDEKFCEYFLTAYKRMLQDFGLKMTEVVFSAHNPKELVGSITPIALDTLTEMEAFFEDTARRL